MKKLILKLKLNTIEEVEQIVLLLCLGIYFALKNNLITPFQTEVIFFTPYIKKVLKKIGVKKKILDYLIHEGWEMDALLLLDKDIYYKTINDKIDFIFNLLQTKNNNDIK